VSRTLADATVAIVGLGLMGGSLGRALDERCALRLGVDRDPTTCERAVELGVVDEAGTLEEMVPRADLVVLATPVGAIVDLLPVVGALARDGAVVTDLGSTKRAICRALDALPERVSAVGGHPMCGREQGGLEASDGSLYERARWVVVPGVRTRPETRALVSELVIAVGASELELPADRHDAGVAVASHLNYVVAQALLGVLDGSPEPSARELAATGFRGATRLAGGDVDMWADILRTNADELVPAIDALVAELRGIEQLLEDPAALRARLERVRGDGPTR